jgi:p21-activated kinase 1
MTKFFNSNKRPEISIPYDPVHLVHSDFNPSTREFTGLPKEWQQPLQDSGISKSDQEKHPLAVMEVVKFYQEGGGDVWDKMGHAPAPGGSHQPASYRPAPSPYQPMQPILGRSTSQRIAPQLPHNDTLVRANTISYRPLPAPPATVKADPSKSQSTTAVNTPVTERRAPQTATAPQRQEKEKGDKTKDADIVKRLQQICTDADPTRLYRSLVKIWKR